jgi:alkylation response protein AidB-like acyl-CoA dehydrogenase
MDPDQDQLRSAVRTVLAREAPLSVASRTGASAADRVRLWSVLTDLGLPGVLVPEAYDGNGLNYLDLVVALEEAGRVLLDAPLAATAMAVAAVLVSGDAEAARRFLPGIASGASIGTVALMEQDDPVGVAPMTRARYHDGVWTLTGRKELVVAGDRADILVVSARTDGGIGLFVVERAAGGLTSTAVASLDQTRTFARLELLDVRATPLGEPTRPELVARVVDLAIVFLAAESVGASQQALDMTVEFASTRVQYDRAIGSFQAIKHRCADMLIEIEYARSAAYYAAWAATSGPDELSALTGVLKSCAAETSVFVAEAMIQIHGGMGFTWEHVAHLFYKRALSDRLLFGSPEIHQDRLADVLGF